MEARLHDRVAPRTSLRKRFEHSRTLDAEAQLRECVEYLENPQILVSEFADSFLTAEVFDNRQEDFCAHGQTSLPMRRWVDNIVQKLIEKENILVRLDPPYQFRYLAREIIPLWSSQGEPADDGADRRLGGGGISYVGVIEDGEPRPVLGVIKPKEDPTPYLSLHRLLTCLAEVSTAAQMERANRFLFKGMLPERPSFDLHIVAVDPSPDARPEALSELTKDLAHQVNVLLKDEWQFPNLLRNIVYASMKSDSFDASLDVEWCV